VNIGRLFALDGVLLLVGFLGYENASYIKTIAPESFDVQAIAAVIMWMGVAQTINHALHMSLFSSTDANSEKPKIPSLLVNITKFCIWFITLLIFLQFYFDFNLAGLWTASSVAIAILGFSLRGMMVDFFSGIAMSIERPFEIGDWIEVESGFIGQVIEMNWRVTKVIAKNNLTRSIPNGVLATSHFNNYGQKSRFMEIVEIELDYKVDAKRAERILLGAANAIVEIQKNSKKPDIRIKEFTHRGVRWQVRFWITHYDRRDAIVNEIRKNILSNLNFSNVIVPREKIDMIQSDGAERNFVSDVELLLRQIALFSELTKEEIKSLSDTAARKEIKEGSSVISYGEYGDSLFVLLEGLLSVHIPNKKNNNAPLEVAKITSGEFFGEMSLLTGEPRSATIIADLDSIVYEINQEDLKPVLQNRETLLNSFVAYLKQRSQMNETLLANYKVDAITVEQEKALAKIKKIFFNNMKKV